MCVPLHVYKDHSIGRLWASGRFLSFEPFCSDVHGLNPMNGCVSSFARDVRIATRADFDRFRLFPSEGYLIPVSTG